MEEYQQLSDKKYFGVGIIQKDSLSLFKKECREEKYCEVKSLLCSSFTHTLAGEAGVVIVR